MVLENKLNITDQVELNKAEEKISKIKSGENNPFYGKTHSDEVKKKLSEKALNQRHSKETREKMSKSMKENHADFNGKNNPRANPVNQYSLNGEFIKRWDYAKEASRTLDINYSSLISCCTGKYKSSGGYIWEYA